MCAMAVTYDLSREAVQSLSRLGRNLINGQWLESYSGQTFPVRHSATIRLISFRKLCEVIPPVS